MPPIRVLFIHGLESNSQGIKVRLLREQGFDVRAKDMHMGLLAPKQRNSMLRQFFRLGETRLVLGLLLLFAGWQLGSPHLLEAAVGLGVLLLWLLVRGKTLAARALARSFTTCVDIQRRALEEESPEVVVGSSWGGAVATELVGTGAWKGPTILLAPALARVAARMENGQLELRTERLKQAAQQVPVVLFHDPDDGTIPFSDSLALAEGSPITLQKVSAGGHRLMDLLHSGTLAAELERLVGRVR